MTTARALSVPVSLLLLLASLVPAAGCGKKGPPRPIVKVRPGAISDLSVRQRGRSVLVDFTLPAVTTTGQPFTDFAEVEIYKLREEEPQDTSAPSDGGAPASGAAASGATGSAVPRGRFIAAYDFLKKSDSLVKLARADVPRYTKGLSTASSSSATMAKAEGATGPIQLPSLKLEVKDDLAAEPIGGESPNRLYYAAIVRDGQGRKSDLSNIDSIVPLVPPAKPENLKASVEGQTVKLEWDPPSTGDTPKGYRIARAVQGKETIELVAVPIKETDYTDLVAGAGADSVTYLVRSSATLDSPYVESDDAATVTVSVKDTKAPEAPSKVRASGGPGRIDLYWDRSASADATGYAVYRAERKEGPFVKLTDRPVSAQTYSDTTAKAATTYFYAVTAVDAAGNESERSTAVPGRR